MENFKIKQELKEQFKKDMGQNCSDAYSFGVVEAVIKVIIALDQGKTPKEAHDAMYGLGLSGFMAGCTAQIVSKYHERGDEFRDFWNEHWGVTKEKANGGVVNPAIINIGPKEH